MREKTSQNVIGRAPLRKRKNTNMTKREFMATVIALAESVEDVNEELVQYAKNEIDRLDVTNAKRREASAKKSAENAEFVNMFVEMLTSEPMTASDILGKFKENGIERPDGKELNVQWVSSLAKRAVECGSAEKTDVKVKGKGVAKGYYRVG